MGAKPARGVVRPGERLDGEPMPLPAGLDYVDEVVGRGIQTLADDDLISVAIGSPIFVERPGAGWLPWITTVDPPLQFARYYPRVRLCVDVFPPLDNLDQDAQARLKSESTMKVALAAEYGYRYIALYQGQQIDSRMFYTAPIEPTSSPPVVDAGGIAVEEHDLLTRMVGAAGFLANAGPPDIPWAVRLVGGHEWASEKLLFSRFYWSPRLLVDLLPAVETLYPQERAALEEEVDLKKRLAAENGVPYLVLWGRNLPTEEEVSQALAAPGQAVAWAVTSDARASGSQSIAPAE